MISLILKNVYKIFNSTDQKNVQANTKNSTTLNELSYFVLYTATEKSYCKPVAVSSTRDFKSNVWSIDDLLGKQFVLFFHFLKFYFK